MFCLPFYNLGIVWDDASIWMSMAMLCYSILLQPLCLRLHSSSQPFLPITQHILLGKTRLWAAAWVVHGKDGPLSPHPAEVNQGSLRSWAYNHPGFVFPGMYSCWLLNRSFPLVNEIILETLVGRSTSLSYHKMGLRPQIWGAVPHEIAVCSATSGSRVYFLTSSLPLELLLVAVIIHTTWVKSWICSSIVRNHE